MAHNLPYFRVSGSSNAKFLLWSGIFSEPWRSLAEANLFRKYKDTIQHKNMEDSSAKIFHTVIKCSLPLESDKGPGLESSATQLRWRARRKRACARDFGLRRPQLRQSFAPLLFSSLKEACVENYPLCFWSDRDNRLKQVTCRNFILRSCICRFDEASCFY